MFGGNPQGTIARGAETRRAGRIGARPRKRGVTSVLAMLYLMLFTALALGFYAQTNISEQVAGGEFRTQEAQVATESGLQFLRYQLSAVNIPPGLTNAQAFQELYAQLCVRLEGTANLGNKPIGYTAGSAAGPAVIRIPDAATDYIRLSPNGPRFRAVITDAAPQVTVKVVGCSARKNVLRAAQVQFQRAPRPYALVGINSLTMSGSAFTDSYDASKGAYDPTKARSQGSVASNGSVTLKDTAKVKGDVRYGAASSLLVDATATITGARAHVTSAPAFPSVALPPAGTYSDIGDVNNSSGTQTIAGGTYVINNLTLSGTARIVWTGPVKLYIKSSYNVSGDVSISTYNNLPVNRQLYFLPTCTTANWSGTNVCVGDLYAPDTNFTISGSVQKLGRVIAKTINNSSSGGMHYDESLPAANGIITYAPVPTSYLEVAP